MNRTAPCLAALAAAALLSTSFSLAQPAKDAKATTSDKSHQPAAGDHAVPPGMSEADMQACMAAAIPGEMHQYLAKSVGTWTGKVKMWMPGVSEPMASECTTVITPVMDGRFFRCETEGEMPGMGPFQGSGVNGFDNVSQKFQGTWYDNMGTGMMVGTGTLAADGKTITWNFTYNCPITKGPATMRQVDRRISDSAMSLEMFGTDPATGKEMKIMEIAYTRAAGKDADHGDHSHAK
ncbi:MAG: DUF1579 domain-containing protein [Phycisphaeraceae bacterium]|nr:DUF1579 domain-containing protein [Phycisphaeraceae bacterium]